MADVTEKQFSELIAEQKASKEIAVDAMQKQMDGIGNLKSAQNETTRTLARSLMSAEERAAADAETSRQNANRVAGGIQAAETRKANADAESLASNESQGEESSSLLSKIGKGFTSFLSFSKGSASADKETENETEAGAGKMRGLLGKIAGGIAGLSKSFADGAKEKMKKGFGGFMSMLKKFAIGGLMTALLLFMNSKYWEDTKKFISDNLMPKLEYFYNAFFGPDGGFASGFDALFGDVGGLGGILLGIGVVVTALAAFKIIKLFKKIKAGYLALKASTIKNFLDPLKDMLKGAWTKILATWGLIKKGFLALKAATIANVLTPLQNSVKAAAGKAWTFMKLIPPALVAIKLFFLSTFLPAVTAFMVPLLPIIAAAAAIGVVLFALKSAFDDFMTTLDETGSISEALKVGISKFMGTILGFIPAMILKLVGWVAGLFGFDDFKSKVDAIDPIQFISDTIKGLFDKIFNWMGLLFADPVTALTELVSGFFGGYLDIASWLVDQIKKPIVWLLKLFGWDDAAASVETFSFKGFVMGMLTKAKDWVLGIFSWAETAEEGDSWIVKTIKGVITTAKEWISSLFVFDGSLISLAGTAINVLTFFPNMVMKGILAASKWLLGLFGFDNAAEKLANPEDFSIGGLIMEAVDSIIKWFKNLLDFDFKSILKNIPGAQTVMNLLGGDDSEFYNPEIIGNSEINRKNVGNASNAQLKDIIKDDDLNEKDMAFVKKILATRESGADDDSVGGGLTDKRQKELDKEKAKEDARLKRRQDLRDKQDEIALREHGKSYDETKVKRVSGRLRSTPDSRNVNRLANQAMADDRRARIKAQGETEDNAITMRKAKLDMEMGRNRGSSANNNVDASQKVVNANKSSFTSVGQSLENKSMAGMTAGGF